MPAARGARDVADQICKTVDLGWSVGGVELNHASMENACRHPPTLKIHLRPRAFQKISRGKLGVYGQRKHAGRGWLASHGYVFCHLEIATTQDAAVQCASSVAVLSAIDNIRRSKNCGGVGIGRGGSLRCHNRNDAQTDDLRGIARCNETALCRKSLGKLSIAKSSHMAITLAV